MKIWSAALVLAASVGSTARANAEAKADGGVDFIADAKLFYRVVACKGSEPIPASLDADVIAKHCTEQQQRYDKLAERYVTPAQTFFAGLRPTNLPATIQVSPEGQELARSHVMYTGRKR